MLIGCVLLTAVVFWGVLQYRTIMDFKDAVLFSVIISPYGSVAINKACLKFNM